MRDRRDGGRLTGRESQRERERERRLFLCVDGWMDGCVCADREADAEAEEHMKLVKSAEAKILLDKLDNVDIRPPRDAVMKERWNRCASPLGVCALKGSVLGPVLTVAACHPCHADGWKPTAECTSGGATSCCSRSSTFTHRQLFYRYICI